jgi:hypothetical protein
MVSVEFGDNFWSTQKTDCRSCVPFTFQSNVSMRRYVLKVRSLGCILCECVHECVHLGGMCASLCIYMQRPEEDEGLSTPIAFYSLEMGSSIEPGTRHLLARLWASKRHLSSLGLLFLPTLMVHVAPPGCFCRCWHLSSGTPTRTASALTFWSFSLYPRNIDFSGTKLFY